MRLLYIIHQFMPEYASGTEQVTFRLAKAAQRAGHHVDVLCCSMKDLPDWQGGVQEGFRFTSVRGLPVYALPVEGISDPYGFASGGDRDALDRFGRFLDVGRYDLVHVTHSLRMLLAITALRARSIPYIMTLTDFFTMCWRINLVRTSGAQCGGPRVGETCRAHCATTDRISDAAVDHRWAMLRDVLYGASELVACSPFVRNLFLQEFPELRIRVLEHGIDLLRFQPPVRRDDGPIVFGYTGTISDDKGVRMLAEAFTRAAPADARLELVGPIHHNYQTAHGIRQLSTAAVDIRLRSEVPSTEIPSILAGFDVLCVPSYLPETFSLALHEGFAAGLPCLVSDLGNPADVVRRHDCGLVLPAGDVEAWARAIAELTAEPERLDGWRKNLPLPIRVEEETFLYDHLYRSVLA